MSINEVFPMRKRRQINKTPGKASRRSSTNSNEGKLIQQTPKRITANNSFGECDIVWDNYSPSPSRTSAPGKRKKKTVSDDSDNNDIADLVKKLANKTGQTPTDSSLYSFWFNEQESSPGIQQTHNAINSNKITLKQNPHLETPTRRKRVSRKGKKSKTKVTQELEMLASMVQNTETTRKEDHVVAKKDTCSSKFMCEATSPLTSHPGNIIQPTAFQNKVTPESCSKRPKISSKFIKHSSPSLSDIDDIDWGDDDVDGLLSQVDISAMCQQEDQVFTATQRSDMVHPELTTQGHVDGSCHSSFVTESWDFEDDDSDELLLTLEQVERTATQSVNMIPDARPQVINVNQQSSSLSHSEVGLIIQSKSTSESHAGQASKCVYSKKDIERKRLEAQQRRNKSKLQTAKNRPNTRQQTTNTNRLIR